MSNEETPDGYVGTDGPTDSSSGPDVAPQGIVHRAVDETNATPMSAVVIEALAEAKGVSTLDLEPPLYEAIDPDALDRLSRSWSEGGNSGRLAFSVSGYRVTVTVDDDVYVCVYAE